jgi:dolichol kinase
MKTALTTDDDKFPKQPVKLKKSSFAQDESQQIPFSAEALRKGTHLGALVVPFLYIWWLDSDRGLALAILVPLALFMSLVEVSRLRGWRLWKTFRPFSGSMIRKHEEAGDFTGAFYILWMFCLVIAVFDPYIATISVSFIIVGDTLAALIGRRFGKRKFRGKSLEGSLACLFGTVAVAFVGYELFSIPLTVGILGAFVATLVEAIPDFVDDNLSVPLVSALVMTLTLRTFYVEFKLDSLF